MSETNKLHCQWCGSEHHESAEAGDACVCHLRRRCNRLTTEKRALLTFVKDFLIWRSSAEGPEVLFEGGAQLIKKARKLIAEYDKTL